MIGIKQLILFTIASDKPAALKTLCEPETIALKKTTSKSISFFSGKEKKGEVDLKCETMAFTSKS